MELVQCRWRREPTGEGRHMCVSPRLVVGASGVPDAGCESCRYRDHDPPPRPRLQCVHLGERTGTVGCPPCEERAGRPVDVPLHACEVHGRCTIGLHVAGHACCASCSAYRSPMDRPSAGEVRHLTYFVFPRGPRWRWNVAQLRERMSLFNGRRLMAVAVDATTDSADAVRAELAGLDCEIREFRNDPNDKERIAMPWALETLSAYTGDADVTFYGHAKGVASGLVGSGVTTWAEEMYRGCLDYWPAHRAALRTRAASGVFRARRKHPPGVPVQWWYCGSFRWVRNKDLYRANWRELPPGWMAPEFYPQTVIHYDDAACLYGEFVTKSARFYSQGAWDEWGSACAEQWRREHVADRWRPMIATVILTSHCKEDLVHQAVQSVREQLTPDWQLLIIDSGNVYDRRGFDRYSSDARISVHVGGPMQLHSPERNGQAWAINECWRRGLVRGDVILHLCDDDVLFPAALHTIMARAAAQPSEGAWYGSAERVRLTPAGVVRPIDTLGTCGIAGPGNTLLGRVDGMQVAHRRCYRTDWPEDGARASHGDGHWIDALGAKTPIVPLSLVVGQHRHTPQSTFTR